MNRMGLVTIVALLLAAAASPAPAQDSPERITVAFSDPSRPGTLKVHLVQGSITVRASANRQAIIDVYAPGDSRRPVQRADGLRRLTQRPSITVVEEDNVLRIEGGILRPVEVDIQVPSRTNLNINTMNNGEVLVEGIEGDIDVSNLNGTVTLTNVAGSVVAHSANGGVKVTLTRIAADKPMAFTSLNGSVDVTLPSSAKIDVRLRSDQGDVFTDFDVQVKPAPGASVEETRRSRGRYRLVVEKTILGTINGGGPEIELRTVNGDVFLRKGK